jgi:urease accessory protein
VHLTNPGGGVLGGDRLELAVSVAPGARATIRTQGATKVYRGAEAVQRTRLEVQRGGLLEYLPHHAIPFAGSSYRQHTSIALAADAELIAWDALAAGRLAHGERFAFDHLATRMLVLRDCACEAIDGCELDGGGERFGGHAYMATVYVVAPRDLAPLADELHLVLAALPGAFGSASAPRPHVAVARLLAADAPTLYTALNRTRAVARAALGIAPPAREVR